MINLSLLLPNLGWLAQVKGRDIHSDLIASFTVFLISFPQAIAVAIIAGLPPVYGLYAVTIPTIVAALWGSSFHGVTVVGASLSVLMISAVSPLATPGSEPYINIVLLLTLFSGIIQLSIGLLGLGRVLDYISPTVVAGLMMAIAITIMFAVIPTLIGSTERLNGSVVSKLMQLPQALTNYHWPTIIISATTVLLGLLMNRIDVRFSFLFGLLGATLLYHGLSTVFPAYEQIEMLGAASIEIGQWSFPDWSAIPLGEGSILSLIVSAFSLALLAMTQTAIFARTNAQESGQNLDVNREISGLGLANVASSFMSGYTVSGTSVSIVGRLSGGKTPLAAILVGVLGLLIAQFAGHWISLIPKAVLAGGMFLMAISMLKPREALNFRHPIHEFVVFLATLLSALGFGLVAGIMTGVVLSILIYLWKTARPDVRIENQTGTDGRLMQIVTVNGSLFFGAVQYIESLLHQAKNEKNGTLIIRTDQVSYIDNPGMRLLINICQRHVKQGGEFYLYVVRDTIYKQLELAQLLDDIGQERIIRPFTPHPLQAVMQPHLEKNKSGRSGETSILSRLEPELLTKVKQHFLPKNVKSGDVLIEQGSEADGYYVISQGEASVERYSLLDGNIHQVATLRKGDAFGEEALLQGNSRNASVRMLSDGKVLFISDEDFKRLLFPVLVPEISQSEAGTRIANGKAVWLDCRFEAEFEADHRNQSLNLPLNQIRGRSHELKDSLEYIVYCDNGHRSRSATFLLRERGLNAYHLNLHV